MAYGKNDILVMQIGESIQVTGKASALAEYTGYVLMLMKSVTDREAAEKARKEVELAEKLGNLTFADLMKMEREEEE